LVHQRLRPLRQLPRLVLPLGVVERGIEIGVAADVASLDMDLPIPGHSFLFLRSMPAPGGAFRFCFASSARRAWSGIVPPGFRFGVLVAFTSTPRASARACLISPSEIAARCIAFWAPSICCWARAGGTDARVKPFAQSLVQ